MRLNRKRRKEEDSEVSSDWMNVYGDMVTLLLTFFVLLFSFSTIDAEKWRALVKTFGSGGKIIVIDESNGNNQNGVVISELESIEPVSKPPELSSVPEIPSSSSPPVSKPPVSKPPVSKPPVSKPPESKPPESSPDPSEDPSSGGGTAFPGFDDLYNELSSYVSTSGNSEGVIVDRGEGTIRIRFLGTVLFEPSSAEISPDSITVIKEIAQIIDKHIENINFMESQGHTDNSPITNNLYKDNWELSGVRAYNVLTELIKNSNIDKSKIKFSGFGEQHPIATNENQEGRDRNNRVDIIIS